MSSFVVEVPILRTPRLLLREIRMADLDAYAAHGMDEAARVHVGGVIDRAESLRRMLASSGLWVLGGRGWWTVELPGVGPIGTVGGFHRGESPFVELGWTIFRDWWGHGFATEAAAAVRDLAVDGWGVRRLVANVAKTNTPSAAVAQKLGLVRTDEPSFFGDDTWVYAWNHPPG